MSTQCGGIKRIKKQDNTLTSSVRTLRPQNGLAKNVKVSQVSQDANFQLIFGSLWPLVFFLFSFVSSFPHHPGEKLSCGFELAWLLSLRACSRLPFWFYIMNIRWQTCGRHLPASSSLIAVFFSPSCI